MCDQCEVLNINGTNCHEQGCPEAWKDYTRECYECGCDFTPTEQYEQVCPECVSEYEDYHS